MKNLVYTSIFGNYDNLNLLKKIIVEDNFDYICISDKFLNIPEPWKLFIVTNKFSEKKIMNRWTKFCIHLILPDYSNCLYHDGNVVLKKPPSFFFNKLSVNNKKILFLEHPSRKNIQSEVLECVLMRHIDFRTGLKFLFRTSFSGFKDKCGLTNNRLFVRTLQDEFINEVFEKIFIRYLEGPKRDQLHSMIEFTSSRLNLNILNKEIIYELIEIYPHINNFRVSKRLRIVRRILYTIPFYIMFKISFLLGSFINKFYKWLDQVKKF